MIHSLLFCIVKSDHLSSFLFYNALEMFEGQNISIEMKQKFRYNRISCYGYCKYKQYKMHLIFTEVFVKYIFISQNSKFYNKILDSEILKL